MHRWRRVFVPMVWLALVQIMVITLLASSPDLHEFFHPDAHEDSDHHHHHCLATDFQSGFIEQPVVVTSVTPTFSPVPFEIMAAEAEAWHSLPLHLCGSLLVHGPPVPA